VRTKEIAVLVSGILGFVIPTYFAWTIYQSNIPQSIATWSMILLLDFIGLVLVIKDGNKKPYLQIGWAAAALCIMLAVTLSNSPWRWGQTETISLVLCGVAVLLWLTMSARVAIWAYMTALYVSFVPLMVDYWYKPQPETLWLWIGTIGTCLLAIYGAPKRDFTNTFVPWAAIVLNAVIAVLCIL